LAPLIALGQYSGFEWAWARPKFQVYDLIPVAQPLFPKFGVGIFYSCVILEVGGVSHYVCVIILHSYLTIPFCDRTIHW